jgi:hypothetical protein
MFRFATLFVVSVAAVFLVVVAGAGAGNGAQVTKATLASFWGPTPMTCDEQQVINANGRKETFHCKLPAPGGRAQVYNCGPGGAVWFSDFPGGAQAVACHITIAPNGNFEGWATY